MENYFKILIIILVLSVFFSNWGIFTQRSGRVTFSFSDILAMFFIVLWFLRKLIKGKLIFSKDSIIIFLAILGIIISGIIGGCININKIDKIEHVFGVVKLLFWGIFMLAGVDLFQEIYKNIKFSNRLWKYYLNGSFIVSAIAIFQYLFYLSFHQHLNFSPFFQQHWGVYGGYYRATGIFQEPSFLGVILLPPLIAEIKLFLTKDKLSYLFKALFIFCGVLVSFSLGSFLVLGVWLFFEFLKWIFQKFGIFLKVKTQKKELKAILAVFFLIIIGLFIVIKWVFPFILPRLVFEFNNLISNFKDNSQSITSGANRFSSYEGFLAILKSSPLFGVGFDQEYYIGQLLGKTFESNTGSGIFGFIGTSAGIIGVILIFYIFWFIFKGGISKNKVQLKERLQPDLLIIGKTIIMVLLLEQLISYGGILNPDFWLPLAFAYLFIRTGQYQAKKQLALMVNDPQQN